MLVGGLDSVVLQCRGDATRTLEFVNERCLALTGFTAAELLRERKPSWMRFVHVEDRTRVAATIREALAAGRSYAVDYRVVARDGAVKEVRERGSALAAPARRGAVAATVEDITAERTALAALEDSERRFRSLFENATEGIFQTPVSGRYLSVNPALATIYGYDSPAALMTALHDIEHQLYVDPARRGDFKRLMQENGAVTNFVSEVQRRDGSRIWISENARAVLGDAGEILFFEGTVEDVTESKRNQDKLE